MPNSFTISFRLSGSLPAGAVKFSGVRKSLACSAVNGWALTLVLLSFGAGLGFYALMGISYFKLKDQNASYSTPYDIGRVGSIACFAVGAGLAITGLVLHSRHNDREAPAMAVAPTPGGAMFALAWQR